MVREVWFYTLRSVLWPKVLFNTSVAVVHLSLQSYLVLQIPDTTDSQYTALQTIVELHEEVKLHELDPNRSEPRPTFDFDRLEPEGLHLASHSFDPAPSDATGSTTYSGNATGNRSYSRSSENRSNNRRSNEDTWREGRDQNSGRYRPRGERQVAGDTSSTEQSGGESPPEPKKRAESLVASLVGISDDKNEASSSTSRGASGSTDSGDPDPDPAVNSDPYLPSFSCNTTTNMGEGYLCNLSAVDDDGDPLTWSLNASHTCVWTTIDVATGEIQGTPALENLGSCDLGIRIEDDQGGSAEYTLTIAVNFDPLNTSFGSGGKLSIDLLQRDSAFAIAEQADGKLVVIGAAGPPSTDMLVMRLNSDGNLDSTFGGGSGYSLTPVGNNFDYAYDVVIQSDGKIVVVGESRTAGPSQIDFTVLRLQIDGSLDASFGVGGVVVVDLSSSNDRAHSVALQADGKILVAGISGSPGDNNNDFGLIRLNPDGSLDTSFAGGSGINVTDLGAKSEAFALQLLSDGSIVVGGYIDSGGSQDLAVVKYTSMGIVDASFGVGGMVITDIAGSDEQVKDIAIDGGGRILVAGWTTAATQDFVLMRLTSGGSLDPSFGGGDGLVTSDSSGGDDQAQSLGVTADGHIVLGGWGQGANQDFMLAVYDDQGQEVIQSLIDIAGDTDSGHNLIVSGQNILMVGSSEITNPNSTDISIVKVDLGP